MNWREKLVIRILLLVARIVAAGIEELGDPNLATEIRQLAAHINLHVTEEK